MDITFLLTAAVHIDTFQTLMDALAPDLQVQYIVDESLLEDARNHGLTAELQQRIEQLITPISHDSKVLVCTCSTIGGLVERQHPVNGCHLQRIDRAMADYSIANARHILVLAALASTLGPTEQLLQQSAAALGKTADIDYQLIDGAWDCFVAGDRQAYEQLIRDAITRQQYDYDLILLAQASMAGAVTHETFNIPVVTSPELGVRQAIATVRSFTGR